MNHTEAEYINAGFHYERGTWSGHTIRQMIESERIEDRAEARRLVARGQQDARDAEDGEK
jgi:hypothetical protein